MAVEPVLAASPPLEKLTSGHGGAGGVMRNGNVAWIEELFELQGRTWEASALLSGKEFSATDPKAVARWPRQI